jgi:hypothetical protein
MSNYTKTTDFQAKDSLPAGDSNKVIRGSEFETEFDNIATAVNSKADTANATLTGTTTFETISDGVINVTAFVDEDNMASNSATLVPTQQSVKSYVDSQITANNELSEVLSNGNTTGGSNISFGDNDKAVFGAGSDLQIYHDGSSGQSFIKESGTGHLRIQGSELLLEATNGDNFLRGIEGGSLRLYHDNSQVLQTSSTGIDVTGNATFADNGKAVFGAGSDLQIYHDGSNSFVTDEGNGSLYLRGSSQVRVETPAGENMAIFNDNGAVSLRYNNAKKFETTSTGIDVTGTVTADGLTVDGVANFNANNINYTGSSPRINFYENDATDLNSQLINTLGDFFIRTVSDNAGTTTNRFSLDHATGDISFYEDTGTTAKFFWDASTERLGLGTTSPEQPITVGDTSDSQNYIQIKTSATGAAGLLFSDGASTNPAGYLYDHATNSMQFKVNGSEKMRLDSAGNLLVGKTSSTYNTVGTALGPDGRSFFTADGSYAGAFNRKTSDGDIVLFSKNGNTVGSIGTDFDVVYLANGSNFGIRVDDANNGELLPVDTSGSGLDASADLGRSVVRWKDLYLSGNVYANALIHDGDSNTYVAFLPNRIYMDRGGNRVFDADSGSTRFGKPDGTEAMRIDSSGNFGLGVVPKSSSSPTWQHIQFGGTGNLVSRKADATVDAMFASNYYVNASEQDSYITTGAAARMFFNDNVIRFDQAASGTGGSVISWSEAMRIDSSGNVGIGATAPGAKLDLSGTNRVQLRTDDSFPEMRSMNTTGSAFKELGLNGLDLRFLISNTEKARLDSSGRLGLGTSSPEKALHINSGTSNIGVRVESSDATASIEFMDSGTTGSLQSARVGGISNDFFVQTNGTERMRIDSSGRVLVGQSSNTGSANADNLVVGTGSGNNGLTILSGTSNGGTLAFADSDADEDGFISFNHASQFMQFGTAASEAMRIDSSGRLGLGTSSPATPLHISTNVQAVAQLESAHANGSYAIWAVGGTKFGDVGSNKGISGSGNTTDFMIASRSTYPLLLGTGSTERMRIDSSGNLLVGTTSTGGDGISLLPRFSGSATTSQIRFNRGDSLITGIALQFMNNTASVGSISYNSTATTYNTSSDQRLKDNIVDAPSASDDIDAIQVRSFDWIADGSHQKYGMVAQELQSVAPEAVTEGETEDDMMGVDYSKLVPMLVKEIQSLRARVAQLEGEN